MHLLGSGICWGLSDTWYSFLFILLHWGFISWLGAFSVFLCGAGFLMTSTVFVGVVHGAGV